MNLHRRQETRVPQCLTHGTQFSYTKHFFSLSDSTENDGMVATVHYHILQFLQQAS